jgi:hypothetical protein
MNLQSLCAHHHESIKKRWEAADQSGSSTAGWPSDPAHPWNAGIDATVDPRAGFEYRDGRAHRAVWAFGSRRERKIPARLRKGDTDPA